MNWRVAAAALSLAGMGLVFYKARNFMTETRMLQLTIRLRIFVGFISVVAIGLAAFTSDLLPIVGFCVALLNDIAISIPIPALECITGEYR